MILPLYVRTNKYRGKQLISDETLLFKSILQPWLFAELVDRYQAWHSSKTQNILRDPRDAEKLF